MATKNNPGAYDCYKNAHPDEPLFILLGRDPVAACLIRLWAEIREELGGTSQEKRIDALQTADKMEGWAECLGKSPTAAEKALRRVMLQRLMERLSE